jgi:hypothetical protein
VKKRIFLAPLFLSLIMISTMMLPAAATNYVAVGVRAGDTADYVFSTPTSSGKLTIQVLQIDGTNVTVNMQETYTNGTAEPYDIITGNLAPAPGTPNLLFPYLVPANLSQGDIVFPINIQTNEQYAINETITMNVNGLNRTVNYLNYTLTEPELGFYSLQAYWDKATGLAIQTNETITGKIVALPEIPAGSYVYNLTSTTAFTTTQPTANATALLILTIGAGILVAAAALTITAAAITQHGKPKTTENWPH